MLHPIIKRNSFSWYTLAQYLWAQFSVWFELKFATEDNSWNVEAKRSWPVSHSQSYKFTNIMKYKQNKHWIKIWSNVLVLVAFKIQSIRYYYEFNCLNFESCLCFWYQYSYRTPLIWILKYEWTEMQSDKRHINTSTFYGDNKR